MARPVKDGIDYFPFDVGFLQDKKVRLIKGEFGAKGIVVLVNLLCSCYGENGYYKEWDEDDCILMAESVGCGCNPSFIGELVKGCVRRSIFDERVFNSFGVLTSRGIQKRYLRAVSTYENIEMINEYWLLNLNDKKDVPASINKKLTFKKIILQNNLINLQNNLVVLQKNDTKEIKEKEIKEKEREEENLPPHANLLGSFRNVQLSAEEFNTLINAYENCNDLINKVSEYLANTTKPYRNHYALICKIAREDKWFRKKVIITDKDCKNIEAVPMPDEVRNKLKSFNLKLGVGN